MLASALITIVNCQPFVQKGSSVQGIDVRILTDERAVRTRQGEYLGGYLAEYEQDFVRHKIFVTLEIHKYVKGNMLKVMGSFTGDSVRMSYGDQKDADFPVFVILKAEPIWPWENADARILP
jgi:hypothetical protein